MLLVEAGARVDADPYRGTALSIPDLVSGKLDVLFDSLVTALGEPKLPGGLGAPLPYELYAGDKTKALEFYTQAIALHRLVGNQRQLAAALRNVGTFHRDIGEIVKALEHLQEARQISRRIGDRHGEASALSHLAKLEAGRGNLADAHKLIQEAISATESLRVNLKSQQLRAAFVREGERDSPD